MIDWYRKIVMTADSDGLTYLFDAIDFFDIELEYARKDTKISGSAEKMLAALPGLMEYRNSQLQQIVHIGKYLMILVDKAYSEAYQKNLGGHKALKSTDADKFAQSDQEYINLKILHTHVEYIRNQYVAVQKALESKNFNLGHLAKLKCAGCEDYVIPNYDE